MNIYQKRTNQLLKEVTAICDDLLIPWFISGRSAVRCYLGELFKGNFYDVEITICAKDVLKFIDACKGKENRFVEGFHNNSNFFGLYLKYIDTTTTLINYNEGLSCDVRGMYIKINILRNVPIDNQKKNKCMNYENLIEDTSKAYCEMTGRTTRLQRALFRFSKLVCKGYNKRLFVKLINEYSSENILETALRTVDGQMHFFEKDRFLNVLIVNGNNNLLWLPNNPEKWFEECYGKRWREWASDRTKEGRPGDTLFNSVYFLCSLAIPYHYFVKEMKALGINKDFFKRRNKLNKIAGADSELMIPINTAWNNANRAGDLWNVYEHYKEKKELIKNLFDIGELGELVKQYQYYDETVKKYMSYDMGFKYDNELWEIYLYIKGYLESAEEVERIRILADEDENLQIQLRNMERVINESI